MSVGTSEKHAERPRSVHLRGTACRGVGSSYSNKPPLWPRGTQVSEETEESKKQPWPGSMECHPDMPRLRVRSPMGGHTVISQ